MPAATTTPGPTPRLLRSPAGPAHSNVVAAGPVTCPAQPARHETGPPDRQVPGGDGGSRRAQAIEPAGERRLPHNVSATAVPERWQARRTPTRRAGPAFQITALTAASPVLCAAPGGPRRSPRRQRKRRRWSAAGVGTALPNLPCRRSMRRRVRRCPLGSVLGRPVRHPRPDSCGAGCWRRPFGEVARRCLAGRVGAGFRVGRGGAPGGEQLESVV